MFEKFRKNIVFLRQIWESIETIAILDEKSSEVVGNGIKLFQLSIKKLMQKKNLKDAGLEIEEETNTNRYEYCSEILKNINMIKLNTLDYLHEIANIIHKVSNYIYIINSY